MDLVEAKVKKRKTQWDIRKQTGIHQSKIGLIERGYVICGKNHLKSQNHGTLYLCSLKIADLQFIKDPF